MKMKRIVSLVLVLALMFGLLCLNMVSAWATEVKSGKCGEDLTWTLDDSGTLTISGTGHVASDMGYRFWARDVKKVVVEEGITRLGENSFNGYVNMTNITLSDTLTVIGSGAFIDCSLLKKINIPKGVTEICAYTFSNCSSLEQINIPYGVTEIEEETFSNCTSLTAACIPFGVTRLRTGRLPVAPD